MKMQLRIITAFAVMLLMGVSLSAQDAPKVSLKFGKGLQVTAADSSMHLKAQFRFQSLYQSAKDLGTEDDWDNSFYVRRARLKFDGWAVNPNFRYKVELALSNRDLASSKDYDESSQAPKIILDAVVKWKMAKNLDLWFGQTKLPGNRERVVSSQKLQFVDRSSVNSIFNIDRDMGVQLRYKMKSGNFIVKPMVAWSIGQGRNITIDNVGGYRYTGRVELLPLGEFASKGDYFSSDLKREKAPKVAFGATYSYNQGMSRQKATGSFLEDGEGNFLTNDVGTFLADMMFKYQGFSVFAEYGNTRMADRAFADGGNLEMLIDANGNSYHTGDGINVQAGYLLKSNWELAGRYTHVFPNTDISFTGQKEYTLGVSRYIVGHSLKVQSDVTLTDKDQKDANNLRYRFQVEFAF